MGSSILALSLPLEGYGGKGFVVVPLATMRSRAPMRPHSFITRRRRILLHVEPIERTGD
jgi:hypothetical protein